MCPGELQTDDAYIVFDCLIHQHNEHGENALRKLLENPVQPWPLHRGNTTTLHRIVHHGTLNAVKIAWQLQGSNTMLNYQDAGGSTPLVLACNIHEPGKAKFFIELGADLDTQDNTGRTALHYAIERDMPMVTGLLLDRHANHQIKDQHGFTALERASAQNYCRNIWQFKQAVRPRSQRTQHQLITAKQKENHTIVGHVDLRTTMIREGKTEKTVSAKAHQYLCTDTIPPTAKLPVLRVDVSITWSVEQMKAGGEAWIDLAIWRQGRMERLHRFCELHRRNNNSFQNCRRTHSASWHVVDSLVDAAGRDEEYGPLADKVQRRIGFVNSIRIGDELRLSAMVAGLETVQVVEEAEISVYYED